MPDSAQKDNKVAEEGNYMDDFEAIIVLSDDNDGESTSMLSSADDDSSSLPLSSDLIQIHYIMRSNPNQ